MTNLLDALKSAQFVTDAHGQQVAIQIQPAVWNALVAWLESTNGGPAIEDIDVSNENGDQEYALLAQAATKLSEPAFVSIWDNQEDDIYNDL